MKILIVFGLLVAYTQATSEPISVKDRIAKTRRECIEENDYDVEKLSKLSQNNILPDDNEELNSFIFCQWRKSGVVNEEGVFNLLQMKVILPHLIRANYPNTSKNEVEELASNSVDECERKSNSKSIGQKCVQLRNCITQYVKDKIE